MLGEPLRQIVWLAMGVDLEAAWLSTVGIKRFGGCDFGIHRKTAAALVGPNRVGAPRHTVGKAKDPTIARLGFRSRPRFQCTPLKLSNLLLFHKPPRNRFTSSESRLYSWNAPRGEGRSSFFIKRAIVYNTGMDERTKNLRASEMLASRLIETVMESAPTILARYPVVVAYIFGSVARKRPLPDSDIDIAILLGEKLEPYHRLQLELEIQAQLEDALDHTVDVRSLNDAPITVSGPIIQKGIRIYESDQSKRIDFEVLTRKKYFDYLPKIEMMREAFFKQIREKGLK